MSIKVKLSPYEVAFNSLNKLPRDLDRVFSAALDDLRRQRDELAKELAELRAYRDRTEAALRELSQSARHMRKRNLERNAIIAQMQMHGLWRDAVDGGEPKETP